MIGVGVGEQEVELVRAKLLAYLRELLGDLLAKLTVAFCQLIQLDDISRPPLESIPGRDKLAIFRGLARHLTRASWVVPDTGFRELLV